MSYRWTNWDQELSAGEDFWDDLDEMDERRQREQRVTRQMETLRRVHERRHAKIKIDMRKFEREEPYAGMCRRPDGTKAPPLAKQLKPPKKGQKQKYHDHKRAAAEREIIATNRFEISGMMQRGMTMKAIAADFEINYKVLLGEVRKWELRYGKENATREKVKAGRSGLRCKSGCVASSSAECISSLE